MGSPRASQARINELNRRNRNLNTKVGQQQYLADQRQRFGLDAVATPDFEFANTAVRQYGRYITDFRPFEEEMLAKRDDTSIIDAVPWNRPPPRAWPVQAFQRCRSGTARPGRCRCSASGARLRACSS